MLVRNQSEFSNWQQFPMFSYNHVEITLPYLIHTQLYTIYFKEKTPFAYHTV